MGDPELPKRIAERNSMDYPQLRPLITCKILICYMNRYDPKMNSRFTKLSLLNLFDSKFIHFIF